MKKISTIKKQKISGGSFYTVALGVGILVSTITGLTNNICELTAPGQKMNNYNQKTTKANSYAFRRRGTYIRYSPFSQHSSIGIMF